MLPPAIHSDGGAASMASGAGSKVTDEWAAAAAGASTPPSAGERVDVLMLGGPLLFWLLLLLSLKRLAFQSSKDRNRSSSTGSKGVKGWRQQMGSSEGLGAKAAMAWNGSFCVVGGEWLERMGDAKSRQRSEDGSHGNGRVNIEMVPMLNPGVMERRGQIPFSSRFLFGHAAIIPPKITL